MAKVIATPKPDSVQFDYHGSQVHEPNPHNHLGAWPRFLPCSGCGYPIGVGDAPAEIMHDECLALQPEEVRAEWRR